MTILCLHCKPKRPPWNDKGRSRVLMSRRVYSHALFRGRATRTQTMTRYRECLDCGFRWTTVEYTAAAKRGRGNPRWGKSNAANG